MLNRIVILVSSSLATISFVLFSFIIYAAFFWFGLFSSISITFYRGIVLALLVALLSIVILFLFPKTWLRRNAAALIALAFAFNIVFLVIFPVTIDRSVTVFLLGHMARHDRPLSESEMEQALTEVYMRRFKAVERRMDEQIISGNVAKTAEQYELTDQGKRFVKLSRMLVKVFNLDAKLVEEQSH